MAFTQDELDALTGAFKKAAYEANLVIGGQSYLSDVVVLSHLIASEDAATAAAAPLTFRTPAQEMDCIFLAYALDSTGASNYKIWFSIEPFNQLDTDRYKAQLTNTFQFTDGYKVRLPANTLISIRAFNSTGTASDGHVILFFLAGQAPSD